jgi:hypothetical protein
VIQFNRFASIPGSWEIITGQREFSKEDRGVLLSCFSETGTYGLGRQSKFSFDFKVSAYGD